MREYECMRPGMGLALEPVQGLCHVRASATNSLDRYAHRS